MSKNVAVFVDVANVFYAAKAAGVDIDYVTLLKSASAGRDLVRAYAYTGLDPDNENQRNFHDFLRRSGYKVVSKDIRKYGDGKVKANLDIELVVDMMKTARNLDIAIVVSGDGDFAPAIRAVQEQGVRVEVISFRGNTSSDLMDVADIFIDITQLAKVEKGSSRSGRRVASDDQDLSMTEVPDKQTEGSGDGRGRGRGRGRTRSVESAAPVRSRSRVRDSEVAPVAAMTATGLPLVALPGEKLARAASSGDALLEDEPVSIADGSEGSEGSDQDAEDRDGPARRRRRRGGRGRGRGRGEGSGLDAAPAAADVDRDEDDDADDTDEVVVTPRPPRATAFGSVWTSQIGTPQPPSSRPVHDDDDLDEPEIPEYLIAERRTPAGQGNRGGGARPVRAGYSAAVDRERYGRGGGGGINRYPDVRPREGGRDGPRDSGRDSGRDGGRDSGRDGGRDSGRDGGRGPRSVPRSTGGDPWSEVPPELEAMLRAQVARRPKSPSTDQVKVEAPSVTEPVVALDAGAVDPEATPKRRGGRRPSGATADTDAPAATKPRAARKTAAQKSEVAASADAGTDAAPAAPKPRGRGKAATASGDDAPVTVAPKPRAPRKTAASAAKDESAAAPGEAAAAPKRRATRKAATPDAT